MKKDIEDAKAKVEQKKGNHNDTIKTLQDKIAEQDVVINKLKKEKEHLIFPMNKNKNMKIKEDKEEEETDVDESKSKTIKTNKGNSKIKKANQLTSCREICDKRNDRMKTKNMNQNQIFQDTKGCTFCPACRM